VYFTSPFQNKLCDCFSVLNLLKQIQSGSSNNMIVKAFAVRINMQIKIKYLKPQTEKKESHCRNTFTRIIAIIQINHLQMR
jgi:hypothetical protein